MSERTFFVGLRFDDGREFAVVCSGAREAIHIGRRLSRWYEERPLEKRPRQIFVRAVDPRSPS